MAKVSFQRLLQSANLLGGSIPTAGAVSFPPPTGPYNTTLHTAELIDFHRLDPFAPTRQPRALMVSVFNPISPHSCLPAVTPYMVPLTAAFEDAQFAQYGVLAGTFESLNLRACNPRQQQDKQELPLILFSPALGTTRLFYSAIAQEVSSAGYTVITIDHPYDVDIVTFPDNTTILAANITEAEVPLALHTRVKDVSFVLDELSKPSIARKLIPTLDYDLNVSKVGIFGHSLGGATAAQAMLSDSRLVGGVNLDGSFFGSVVQKGLNRPLLIFGNQDKNTTTDPTWEAIWPKLTGFKRELVLANSAHYTFSDLPDIVDVLEIGAELPSEVGQLLGTIDGSRAFEIVTVYLRAFFDFLLKGRSSDLLDGPSKQFPEVTFGSP
jgi:pimeloyl-ACP methyl ester carboxylesterase